MVIAKTRDETGQLRIYRVRENRIGELRWHFQRIGGSDVAAPLLDGIKSGMHVNMVHAEVLTGYSRPVAMDALYDLV